ncbi:MAG: hydantoinase/oxoprolinase family protein [Candidatus Tectomicrobia bacterium]|nr:hydantoinase/oxoprolinase family protein [Candidatus Tectomicrobia bacterium]
MARYSVGIDIGGTFTDLVCLNEETGQITNFKVPSTPPTFIEGVLEALRRAVPNPEEMRTFRHGSTIATNAILERKGARTGLVTTEGFRDILEDARGERPEVFDLTWDPPPPLVPRYNRLTVPERIGYEGDVLVRLKEQALKRIARVFRKRGVESVAICFLNAFMNPAHERRAQAILSRLLPGAYICTSSDVFPEMREFERTSTTVVNAYLGPILDRYLGELEARSKAWGFQGDILIIHSGGGVISPNLARAIPARTCLSGPSGGVVGGAYIGSLAGHENLITFDMGGTSADLSLVWKGRPLYKPGFNVEFTIPIRFPCVDITSIGTGGGSIAWIDEGGSLKNGPQSAGAQPGPACYGRGGHQPTNTDAHVVLGVIAPDQFLGGAMTLYPDKAREAIAENVARPLGMSVEEAAEGILRLANANMINAVKLITVVRGYDPRDFAFVAFGGAGPMHAVSMAAELKIPRVIVPRYPGVTSAFGALRVDVRHDFIRPVLKRTALLSSEELARAYRDLEAEARKTLKGERIPLERVEFHRYADVKYFPQSKYMTIAVPPGRIGKGAVEAIVETFLGQYRKEFGYQIPEEYGEVEVSNARLAAIGVVPKGVLRRSRKKGDARDALKGRRRVFFRESGGFTDTRIYDRAALGVGARLKGPAVIEQPDSTTVLPPGAAAVVDGYSNLIISPDGR